MQPHSIIGVEPRWRIATGWVAVVLKTANAARLASGGGNTLVGLGMTGIAGLCAAMWWLGRPRPYSWAMVFTSVIPLLVGIAFGAEPARRIAHRLDDGNLGEREILGNGVKLTWAPDGPGFPGRAQNWREANSNADHLSQDSLAIVESSHHFWRLPTREESVRFMDRHGNNAGASWGASSQRAEYETLSDKEPPLWNHHSEVIYWWSSDEADDKLAWSITYAATLVPRSKESRMGTLGFRLVRRCALNISLCDSPLAADSRHSDRSQRRGIGHRNTRNKEPREGPRGCFERETPNQFSSRSRTRWRTRRSRRR